MTFREWLLRCEGCDKTFGQWAWDHALPNQLCPACNQPVDLYVPKPRRAPGIATDSIRGGIEIRHLGPKPERFYSMTDIKRACNERGFNWADDSPGPYKVKWSGKRRNEADSAAKQADR